MHHSERTSKQGDRLLKMPGKMDRGPVEFKSHLVRNQGEIMALGTRTVIASPPTMRVLSAVETMTEWRVRRLPLIDAGTRHIRGIVTSGDIINFMGGGDKFNLVSVKHGGNFLAAVNEPISSIMNPQVVTLPSTATLSDVLDIIIRRKIGGIPITDENDALAGIVTERDILRVLKTERTQMKVEDAMTTDLKVTTPESPISAVAEDLTKHRFRRLPVVSDEVLFGIITATDIMRFLGSGKVFTQMVTGDVGEIMGLPIRTLLSGELFTTTPEKNLHDVARDMIAKQVGVLPVIEDSRLIGLITEYDLVRALSEG